MNEEESTTMNSLAIPQGKNSKKMACERHGTGLL